MVYIILQLAIPPPLNILKLGAYRGIQECRNQFENNSSWWNCTFDWKRVDRKLPIFFNNTLPHGKNIFAYLWYLWKGERAGKARETLKGNLSRGVRPRPSNPADRVKYKNRTFRLLVQDKRDHFMTVMIHFVFQQDGFFFSARIMEFDCLGKNIFGTTNLDHSSSPFCPKRHPFQDAK